jgi:hypothetical protein
MSVEAAPPDVFISHASEDNDAAKRLHDALESAGLNAWIDVNDIAPGENWSQAIQSALNACDAGLLALSPASAASEECEAEYRHLLKRTRLYVALIEPVPPEQFPWRLVFTDNKFLD